MKTLLCEHCGHTIKADGDDQVWTEMEKHIKKAHPDKPSSRDELMATMGNKVREE